MNALAPAASILDSVGVAPERAREILGEALAGADDGELFVERSESEAFLFDDGRLKSASYDSSEGFGLRVVAGETAGYSHSSEVSEAAIKRAGQSSALAKRGYSGVSAEGPRATNTKLYGEDDPTASPAFSDKVALLQEIDAWVRARDPRVVQVMASIAGERRIVEILRADGRLIRDVRPLCRVNVQVTLEKDGKRESGYSGAGGRAGFDAWIAPDKWQGQADEAIRQALVNLDAVPCPAGEMDVVLGPGWNGVLLHEAVGHGLEGDFNRKGTSAFSGKIGQRVAAPGVTVFDDGTLPGRRGSLTVDDEGTPTERTILIEDGILVGYMHDRMSARLMGMTATGNGRRQSYAHMPMPRMTNTAMLGGQHKREEMIASTKRGLYCANFGGGQVDITNGKFVFQCTEAYLIEDGKITTPVKGATLIGDGPSALTRVTMIGDDFDFDAGVGVCGKSGQSVPVGVGQPSLKLTGLTVGGTSI
ncbi:MULTISPECIES: metalloprotease TldD [unclassified Phenylobacterium]|uniref:metalloprotease TldD n=1 Tax=unclassified Phenylobacterium TaxID=2640670 RepID=UPI0022B33CA0|nr:metalloprotease TldD [Phenylobacterium sp. NIBR 498073]MBS0490716.1 metalloprotease TldD [Pseudomonadota bacterium]WGU41074.1 metalloprotease TldD [Phenylobacterium sp. NIBR 498073]